MSELILDRFTLPAVEVPALYVHVPFCFHKCHYRDFYSITRQTPGADGEVCRSRAWGRRILG